ncbi:MAG TPA: response regulator [Symbiobacteriaceae bacterium]|nr:response regulator [Symbiobacteriaceae bacterium]
MVLHGILLVEDDPDHEALTLRALRKNNLTGGVIIARDGQEALEYLFEVAGRGAPESPPLPRVVLLDLKLPRVDGLEVLQQVKSDPRTAAVPVVVLTSSDEVSDIAESYQRGANSYVLKPVDYDRFVEAIKQISQYWLILNQVPAGG